MHRRGGAGLAAFDRHKQANAAMLALSTELSQSQLSSLEAQLHQFRQSLSHFARTHRELILSSPSFRHSFTKMCVQLGVDPLAGPRKGGWWAEMMGLGDWNCELGVQVVDVCVSTRERNGGLIELGEVVRLVGKLRGGEGVVTEEDIVRAIKTLEPLGAGYELLTLGTGVNARKMVRSVVKELDSDAMVVLAIAQEDNGRVDEGVLVGRRGWSRERASAVLENMLMRDGMCWLDEQDGPSADGRAYWVPSAMKWDL